VPLYRYRHTGEQAVQAMASQAIEERLWQLEQCWAIFYLSIVENMYSFGVRVKETHKYSCVSVYNELPIKHFMLLERSRFREIGWSYNTASLCRVVPCPDKNLTEGFKVEKRGPGAMIGMSPRKVSEVFPATLEDLCGHYGEFLLAFDICGSTVSFVSCLGRSGFGSFFCQE